MSQAAAGKVLHFTTTASGAVNWSEPTGAVAGGKDGAAAAGKPTKGECHSLSEVDWGGVGLMEQGAWHAASPGTAHSSKLGGVLNPEKLRLISGLVSSACYLCLSPRTLAGSCLPMHPWRSHSPTEGPLTSTVHLNANVDVYVCALQA